MTEVNKDGNRQMLASEGPNITILPFSPVNGGHREVHCSWEHKTLLKESLGIPGWAREEDSTAESMRRLPMLETERGQGGSLLKISNFRGLSPF